MTKIIITRRIALSAKYEFYELTAEYDSLEQQGDEIITDMERTVAYIRTLTQTLPPAEVSPKDIYDSAHEPEAKTDQNTRIADLRAGDKKVDIVVRLVSADAAKKFTKKDGTEGIFCKAKIIDNSVDKAMTMTVWDDHVKTLQELRDDAWLTIQNAYVKEYRMKLELNVGEWARLEVAYYAHEEESE